MNAEERATLEEDGLLGQYRLSCQIRVTQDMTLDPPDRASDRGIPARRPARGLSQWHKSASSMIPLSWTTGRRRDTRSGLPASPKSWHCWNSEGCWTA